MDLTSLPNRLLARIRALGRAELIGLFAALLILVGIWGFSELASEVTTGDTRAFDEWAVQALRAPEDPALPRGPAWLVKVGRDITALGGYAVITLITVFLAGFLYLRRQYGTLKLILFAVIGGALLNYGLKLLFARQRPEAAGYINLFTPSFPSGHAMVSAIVYLSLGALLARLEEKRRVKIYIIGVAMTLTILVGASRVYLGAHYPTDVFAGWTAGLVWAIICLLTARYLERHRGLKDAA